MSEWTTQHCALCGRKDSTPILQIPHPNAPGGRSFVTRCTNCGLRRLDQRPSEAVLSGYYSDSYNAFVGRTRGRLKQWGWDLLRDLSSGRLALTRRSKLARQLLQGITSHIVDINLLVPRDLHQTVLDVGCGYGDLLIYFKSRGCRVRGVEADPRAARKAREYGVEVAVEDPSKISLPPGSVDATILCHSLEHLPDPRAALAEVARVSRPGAEIHVAVPNGNAVGLDRQGAAWGHLSYPLHFWYFDASTLVTLLRETGFELESVSYRMTWGFHWLTWKRAAESRGWSAVLHDIATTVAKVVCEPERRDVLRVTARRTRHRATVGVGESR